MVDPVKNSDNLKRKIGLVLAGIGFLLGGFVSWGVISGDAQGRVNILYLLLVYLLLPLLSIFISTFSLLFSDGFNLAQCLRRLPLWSPIQQQLWRKLKHQGLDALWFFHASQIMAICFSLAGLLVFFLLLLATDVNFVWRSTLLKAEDLIRVLSWLSHPWSFWEAAQPTLQLLQLTQDSRLAIQSDSISAHSQWWQFILAIQIFYSFLPRSILLIASQIAYVRRLSRDKKQNVADISVQTSENDKQVALSAMLTALDESCMLTNWGGVPEFIITKLEEQFSDRISGHLEAGPSATEDQQASAELSNQVQLVLVKSWEPPLAELADYLKNGQGYLLPLDWEGNQLNLIKPFHLEEWRRFTATIPNWKVLVWPETKNE